MNENRMKSSVNTGEVSLLPVQKAGWAINVRAEQGGGSKKPDFGVAKWLDKPRDERIIAKTTEKTRLDAMNNTSNGKSRLISFKTSNSKGVFPASAGFGRVLFFQTEIFPRPSSMNRIRFILPLVMAGLGLIFAGRVTAQTFTNSYSFTGGGDGANPFGSLILSGNTLYGTARFGGVPFEGTLFAININGTGFTNLHTFTATATNDGANPYAGLILSSNTLYGTAYSGGDSGNGTVFAVNTNGAGMTNLHYFSAVDFATETNNDGANPYAGLALVGKTLYGTTVFGGSSAVGTVFAVNTDGTGFTNLHSFTGLDGTAPLGTLVLSGNTLYGTTKGDAVVSDGTVFAINTDGSGFTNLYYFTPFSGPYFTNSDGTMPVGGLILSGNTLYGTASQGGANGNGTVFAINTNGTFSTLYNFTALDAKTGTINTDGASPWGALTLVGQTLYGTATAGGATGNGTVFAVNSDGTGFTNLHNFTAPSGPRSTNSDGATPYGSLIVSGNNLYGTTTAGGRSGFGTVFGLAAPGFFIVPTFDVSITTNSQAPAIMAAINAAAQVYHANISDNFTVYIKYKNTPNGLAQSQTWTGSYSYAAFLAALKKSASSVDDFNAISHLPDSPTEPVRGLTNISLTLALARRLGLASGEGADGFDSTISLNLTNMNFTRPPGNTNNYDLQETVEHEIDEVLGTASELPDPPPIWVADLFRYATNLSRTITTNGDNSYFSVDGTNLWARYNMDSSGDYGDWWSFNGTNRWAPPGIAPHTQVQDAVGLPGVYEDLGVNELALLDVIGWTVSGRVAQAPVLTIALTLSGTGEITIAWPTNGENYVLQQSTNLTAGSWTVPSFGSNSPAVIRPTGNHEFFRLYHVGAPAVAQIQAAAVGPVQSNPPQLATRIYLPAHP